MTDIKIIKSLESFRSYIKRVSDERLDDIRDQLESEIFKKRSSNYKLGHSQMLVECYIEAEFRKAPPTEHLTDDEILGELGL